MATASAPCTVVRTSPTLVRHWINRAKGNRAQIVSWRKKHRSSFWDDGTMSKGSRVEKQAVKRQTMSSAFVSKCQRIVLKTSRADENGAHTACKCSLIRPQSSLTRPQWFLTRAKCSLTEAKSSVTGVKCSLTDRECSANCGKCSRAACEKTLTGNQATRIRD